MSAVNVQSASVQHRNRDVITLYTWTISNSAVVCVIKVLNVKTVSKSTLGNVLVVDNLTSNVKSVLKSTLRNVLLVCDLTMSTVAMLDLCVPVNVVCMCMSVIRHHYALVFYVFTRYLQYSFTLAKCLCLLTTYQNFVFVLVFKSDICLRTSLLLGLHVYCALKMLTFLFHILK